MSIEMLFNYALMIFGVLGFTIISLILITLIIFLIKTIIWAIKL